MHSHEFTPYFPFSPYLIKLRNYWIHFFSNFIESISTGKVSFSLQMQLQSFFESTPNVTRYCDV